MFSSRSIYKIVFTKQEKYVVRISFSSMKIENLFTLEIVKIESLNQFNFNELFIDFYIMSFVLPPNTIMENEGTNIANRRAK